MAIIKPILKAIENDFLAFTGMEYWNTSLKGKELLIAETKGFKLE